MVSVDTDNDVGDKPRTFEQICVLSRLVPPQVHLTIDAMPTDFDTPMMWEPSQLHELSGTDIESERYCIGTPLSG